MLDRTEMRQMIIALLKDKTSAGDRVFDSKVTPWEDDELPAVSVVTPSQRGTSPAASQTPTFNTLLTVNLEIAVAVTEDWAAVLDGVCEECEKLLLRNPEFIKQFTQIQGYTTTLSYKPEGEVPVVSAVMSFDVLFDLLFEPEFPDDFNSVGMDVKVNEEGLIKAEFKLNQGGTQDVQH